MHSDTPSPKTLFLAWLVLMFLSLGTMVSGRVSDGTALGPWFMLSLLLITLLKASWILRYFLNLRVASKSWKRGFATYLILLLACIYGLYLFGWMN